MDLGLEQSVVIVTGGSDGLGLALAEALIDEGARVLVCGRNPEQVEATHTALSAKGDAVAMALDVTDPAGLPRLVDLAVERWGRIDGLVNNAGQSSAAPIEQSDDAMWRYDLDLKVMAAVRLVRLVLPHLRSSPAASIVNVLNIGAKAPPARSLPTTASRAAGLAITKALSHELGPDGIRVNAILVGFVESGQWRRRAAREGKPIDEVFDEMATGVPLRRVGRREEFADLAMYLLSRRASYVTGSAVNLDGGASPVT